MLIFQNIWTSAAFGAVCAIVVYGTTYLTIGRRANRFPAGAVLPAFFLTPWWPALCAGIAAHIVGVLVTNAYVGRKSRGLIVSLNVVALGFCLGTFYTVSSLTNEVITEVTLSENAAWVRISNSSVAGKFVETHYRPCISTPVTTPAPNMRARGYVVQPDPTICAAATLTLARENGDAFADEVSLIIRDLPNKLVLSPAAQAKLDQLVVGAEP